MSGLGWGFVLFPSPNPQFNNVMVSERLCSLREDVEEHKLVRGTAHSSAVAGPTFKAPFD